MVNARRRPQCLLLQCIHGNTPLSVSSPPPPLTVYPLRNHDAPLGPRGGTGTPGPAVPAPCCQPAALGSGSTAPQQHLHHTHPPVHLPLLKTHSCPTRNHKLYAVTSAYTHTLVPLTPPRRADICGQSSAAMRPPSPTGSHGSSWMGTFSAQCPPRATRPPAATPAHRDVSAPISVPLELRREESSVSHQNQERSHTKGTHWEWYLTGHGRHPPAPTRPRSPRSDTAASSR